MTDMNRTAEWPRLVAASPYTIIDTPGEITVAISRNWLGLPVKLWLWPLGGFGLFLLSALLSENLGVVAAVGALFGMILAIRNGIVLVRVALDLYHSRAAKVVFRPDGVHFYMYAGKYLGMIPREAMQQIALTPCKAFNRRAHYHEFISDGAWVQALPTCCDPSEALLRNNLLMAAFGQPVHLDGMLSTAGRIHGTLAPQIEGLHSAQ